MEFLLVLALVFSGVVLVGWLIRVSRRNRKALLAYVHECGWTWEDRVPNVAADGSAPVLPAWLRPAGLGALQVRERHRVVYSRFFTGRLEDQPLCGFERHMRRRQGKDEGVFSSHLLLQDLSLPVDLPEFLLVRSHGLTNALAAVSDGVQRLDEKISERPTASYRLRDGVPGYEAWRIHATESGERWLRSGPGERLAQLLEHFDAPAQQAFGAAGQIVLAEGPMSTVEQLKLLIANTARFGTLLGQALEGHSVASADGVIRE